MRDLENEQRTFQSELAAINAEYDENKRIVAMEYESYYNSLRNVAAMQVNYPPEVMYVNAYPPTTYATPQIITQGIIQPFQYISPPQALVVAQQTPVLQQPSLLPQSTQVMPVVNIDINTPTLLQPSVAPQILVTFPPPTEPPAVIVETPTLPPQPIIVNLPPTVAPQLVPDHTGHIASLNQFIDTCVSIAKQSPSHGSLILGKLQTIRSGIGALLPTDPSTGIMLNSFSSQVNALLPSINALPRKTVSEVWIDPIRVSSRGERDKLDKLVVQETSGVVEITNARGNDEEVNIATSIPNMFSLVSNKATRNHRLKVFRDHKSRQIKIIATCFHRRFKRHSQKERWFFSYTCDDTSTSLLALTDSGRNDLTKSVLKVVCHSKDFAKRLILEKPNRDIRCHLNKWTDIARGLSDPKFFALDYGGKKAWRSLVDGSGCFNRDEALINSRCRAPKRSSRTNSSRKHDYD
jgi:hypothetical protein